VRLRDGVATRLDRRVHGGSLAQPAGAEGLTKS